MFRQDRIWEHNQQAKAVLSKMTTDLLVIGAALFYRLVSPLLNLYDWRLGIASLVVVALAAGALITHYREFHKLKIARKCPVCGGLLDVSEQSLRGQTISGSDGFAPIVDRISTCIDCGRQHHDVYADWNQTGSFVPTSLNSSFSDVIETPRSIFQKRYPGKTNEEIDQLVAAWEAREKPRQTTREEWEAILKQFQDEAAARNLESGMVFEDGKATS